MINMGPSGAFSSNTTSCHRKQVIIFGKLGKVEKYEYMKDIGDNGLSFFNPSSKVNC